VVGARDEGQLGRSEGTDDGVCERDTDRAAAEREDERFDEELRDDAAA